MRPLLEGEAATFLGAQVGFNVVPPLSTLVELTEIGLKIVRSKLAPWQRLDALKTFFYPSTVHLQRMGTFPKSDWARVDRILRPEIKATLYLPQEASGEYIYGSTKRGCCGIRILAEDADIAAVDSAFKLYTSPDLRVASDAADHAEEVTRRRISKDPSVLEVASYLSGEDEGVIRTTRGSGVSSVWSRARNASKRLNVEWTLGGAPSITHEGTVLGAKHRRAVMRSVRFSALGSWDPANDAFLRVLCSRSYGTLMRKLCPHHVIYILNTLLVYGKFSLFFFFLIFIFTVTFFFF
ncbi:uncharacterized protein LOC132927897 [Rhopalosiphum padi]|uniref:uncharacterized protein LOC132927897 n=1 Tax=Rhopalosiphum padi TaxID=40932 RepID=UPI00298EAA42|nr:uncharacterized protein LOC132927897 [Rhopalosiphum padi]